MADLYLSIREQPPEVLETIAESMNARANEPAMQAICADYLGRIGAIGRGRVVEIGCGNGAATALLARHLDPAELVGVDPSKGLLEMARQRFAGDGRLSFREGDALASGEAEASADVVVAHTLFSHLLDPRGALAEVRRVLKPGGRLAIFDGDYATISFALFHGDPLEDACNLIRRKMVHAPHIMRVLPAMARDAGFENVRLTPYAYVQTSRPDYLTSLLARSLAAAVKAGELGEEMAEGVNREARRRVEAGTFYGSVTFVSLLADKPE